MDTANDLVKLYTDTFISQDVNEAPYKLLKIAVDRFEILEGVASDIQNLNDINNLTGANLDLLAEKWNVERTGDDEQLRVDIVNRIHIYFSGSTLHDVLAILATFDAPAGSTVIERLPPEDAELEVFLNGASETIFNRISELLNSIRGAAIEFEIINELTTDRLLMEDGFFLTYEDGDLILLDLGNYITDEDENRIITEDGDNFLT